MTSASVCGSLGDVLTSKAVVVLVAEPLGVMDKVGDATTWEQGTLSSKRTEATISFSRSRDLKHILTAIPGQEAGLEI